RKLLDGLFTKGPGPINGSAQPDGRLRGALIPHIDFHRGGITYTHGFKEVIEQSDAEVFVILATSHYTAGERFILTRKHFRTPLGVAQTDQAFIDRLEAYYGPGLYEDEVAHLPEHSIEFHVVFLQHCLGSRPFRIVPLLVGSFHDAVQQNVPP